MEPVRDSITRAKLAELAASGFGDLIKDSMINVRPAHGNPSRSVEDSQTRALIRAIVAELVPE